MNIMIDIETLGLEMNAKIVSIGACVVGDTSQRLHLKLDTDSQVTRSRSQSTLEWWERDEQAAARESEFGGDLKLDEALRLLSRFIAERTPKSGQLGVWANHVCFDIGILTDAYKSLFWSPPWGFYQVFDYATVKMSATAYQALGASKVDNTLAHTAVGDAVYQAEVLAQIFAYEQKLIEGAANA